MKEKIIEILGKIGRSKDLNDINSEAFWLEDCADEILALPLYPKSFVEWLQDDCPFWYEMINKYWEEPDSDKKYTLDELYEYWQNLSK